MKSATRVGAGLGLLLVAACLLLPARGSAAVQLNCCTIPQTPRVLDAQHWNYTSNTPLVTKVSDTSISYVPRAGVKPLVLNRCSQHYHCGIENVQACPKEPKETNGGTTSVCLPPRVGDLIEIHTAYHAGPLRTPTPEDLSGCTDGPIVVVGYHTKVVEGSQPPGIPVYFGPSRAEWSGSTTNEDKVPNECKPAVFWSFTLDCSFTVPIDVLRRAFTHPDALRGLQPADRLSHDLTHVEVHR